MEGKTDTNEARCPSLEEIAAFLDGRLTEAQRLSLVKHASNCETCAGLLAETARQLESDGMPMTVSPLFQRRAVLPIAVGVGVAALVALAVLIPRRNVRQLDRAALIDALGGQRPFEPRLTGGFPYGPMRPVMRSASPESQPYKLLAAAAKIKETVDAHESAETMASLGAAQLVLGESDEAVKMLEEANLLEPKNARILTDLAAAYLVHAQEKDHPEDIPKALEAAEKATEFDPKLLEAWFDRAYALETLPLKSEAAKAWRDYLNRDPKSGWADEARKRLAAIEKTPNHAEEWKKAKAKMLAAARAGDEKAIRQLMPDYCQETREWIEEELLPQWAEEEAAGRSNEAKSCLLSIILLAFEQSNSSRDHFLRDVVDRIVAFRPKGPGPSMTFGFLQYRECVLSRRREEYEKSSGVCQEAKRSLITAKSPLALKSEFEAIVDLADSGSMDIVRPALDRIRELSRRSHYSSLEGMCLWEIGLLEFQSERFAAGLEDFELSSKLLRATREGDHVARLAGLVANSEFNLGRPEPAWRNLRSLLDAIDFLDEEHRHSYLAALTVDFVDVLPRVALAFSREDRAVSGSAISSASIVERQLVLALARMRLGDALGAKRALAGADAKMSDVVSPDLVRIMRGEFLTYAGEAEVEVDATKAVPALRNAVAYARHTGQANLLPRIFLALGRAQAHGHDFGGAEESLREGISEFEKFRRLQGESRISYFDQSRDLFAEMINLRARNGGEAALDFAERGRARDLLAISRLSQGKSVSPYSGVEVAQRLPRGVALIYYCALPDQLLAWVVHRNEVRFASVPIGSAQILAIVASYRHWLLGNANSAANVSRCSQDLHNLLIRPLLDFIASADLLVFLPDDPLFFVPFAALQNASNGRYLIEDHEVATVPSGTIFLRALAREQSLGTGVPSPALFIGRPRLDHGHMTPLPDLPEAGKEVEEASAWYPKSQILESEKATLPRFRAIAERFEVIHFAGHSFADADFPSFSYLAFSPGDGEPSGELFAKEISGFKFNRTRVVVLSACETGFGPLSRGEGPLSLARPFLVAGVPNVVASLWQADDFASRRLLVAFHAAMSRGDSPVEALREAQLRLLRSGDRRLANPGAWANFQVIGAAIGPQPES